MENTAKNFALQLGSLISLYVSIGALISLLFGVITIAYPDDAQGTWELTRASTSIRFSLALLIVFFPAYIVLTRFVNTIRRGAQGTYLTLTKWLIYLSLLVGGAVLLGDLVTVLNSFLNGELTTRFILKALTVLIVVAIAFAYYIFDARGYWQEHEKHSWYYAGAVGLFVLISIIFGFQNIETPSEVREMNIDAQQIYDLQNIQSHIEQYYLIQLKLPTTIEQTFQGIEIPTASTARTPYSYKQKSGTTFELCAGFNQPSSVSDREMYAQPYASEGTFIQNPHNWEHGSGDWCFERTVSKTALKV